MIIKIVMGCDTDIFRRPWQRPTDVLCAWFVVCLQDSVLAFHKHGMQGRSFKTDEVTQEICDKTRTFSLLGSDRYTFI